MTDTTRYGKKILVVDFDGVIHSYTSGWISATFIPDPPVPGAMEWLWEMSKEFNLQIYSSRSGQEGGIAAMSTYVRYWAMKELSNDESEYKANALINRIVNDPAAWPMTKPPGFVTLDDRVICFQGPHSWPTLDELNSFKPWNKK